MTLTNVPQQHTSLRLAARKSFALTVKFQDSQGHTLPTPGMSIELVVGKGAYSGAAGFSLTPAVANTEQGLFRFDLQASHLDLPEDEYPYEIVADSLGYSTIAIRGTLEIEDSVDTRVSSYADPSAEGVVIAKVTRDTLVIQTQLLGLRGLPGGQGVPGKDGDPFSSVAVTYDGVGNVVSLVIDDVETTYSYNPDGTLAYDERNGVTRDYTYSNGRLAAITVRQI